MALASAQLHLSRIRRIGLFLSVRSLPTRCRSVQNPRYQLACSWSSIIWNFPWPWSAGLQLEFARDAWRPPWLQFPTNEPSSHLFMWQPVASSSAACCQTLPTGLSHLLMRFRAVSKTKKSRRMGLRPRCTSTVWFQGLTAALSFLFARSLAGLPARFRSCGAGRQARSTLVRPLCSSYPL